MDLDASLLSPFTLGAAWVASLAVIVLAARGAALADALRGHTLPALLVCLLLIWQMRAVTDDGPALHLLGAALLQLCVGWRLAILGIAAVLLTHTANGAGSFGAWGANMLISGILPVAVSHGFTRLVNRRLPGNPFAYIFIAGFAGAAASMIVVLGASIALLLALGFVDGTRLMEHYALSGILIVFPEAFVTGAVLAPLAMFYPHLVSTWTPPWELDKRG